MKTKKTFGQDVNFLKQHTDTVILTERTGKAKIAVAPQLQGRVLTSTAEGDAGLSFGWINRELISSGRVTPHINAYGGEDRFWLGPEGGQFSIFFKKNAPFDLEHWFTPPALDTESFELIARSNNHLQMQHDMRLTNYSGTVFELRVHREITVLEREAFPGLLNAPLAGAVQSVAFQSINRLTNAGGCAWDKSTGLLSIWILGMFNPSAATIIIIPYQAGSEQELGRIVNDSYFGKVPANRLVIGDKGLFFRGDGQYRCKIGLSPKRAKSVLGSYDADNKVLTVIQYSLPEGEADYVNSMWEIQKEPYRGDVINSYNDGAPAPGAKPLGPFYELETSSPAAALEPGKSMEHIHRTFHLQGEERELGAIARSALGVSLDEIKKAFN